MRTRAPSSYRGGDSAGSSLAVDPASFARFLGKQITDALDPTQAPSKVRSFKDMTPEERETMRRLYERKP